MAQQDCDPLVALRNAAEVITQNRAVSEMGVSERPACSRKS